MRLASCRCGELLERFEEEARWFQQRRNGLYYEVDPVRAVAAAENQTRGEVPPIAMVDFAELQRVMRKIVLLPEREVAELFLMGTRIMQEKTVRGLVEGWVSCYTCIDDRQIRDEEEEAKAKEMDKGKGAGVGVGGSGAKGGNEEAKDKKTREEEDKDDEVIMEEFVEYDSEENELLGALLGDDGMRYVAAKTGRRQKHSLVKDMERRAHRRRQKNLGRSGEEGVQILKIPKKNKKHKKHKHGKYKGGDSLCLPGDVAPTRWRVWRRCYIHPEVWHLGSTPSPSHLPFFPLSPPFPFPFPSLLFSPPSPSPPPSPLPVVVHYLTCSERLTRIHAY
jgi:hypothetical protein